MTVTALLVSHDGARWLPAVLDALEAQSRRPDHVLAVDTGSSDTSPDLLTERLGPEAVVKADATTSYPAAVRLGMDHELGVGTDWIWLLHDDSAPMPDALERLLQAAEANPSVSVLGPKTREWPSLRRLLEVGVTISGTGRRETGLERGEYDQGQHDQTREVLAVNTAGMLVRRDLLERLGGFDRRLPIFGNDIDFGWRAARAGHRTLVVPEAVLFHVEAAHRGVRRTPVTGEHRRAERRAALYTLLVNCSLLVLPFQVVRLLVGSLVRAVGFLLVRAPKEALDELVALATTYLRPDRIVAGRLERRRTATVPPGEVRHLLAPPWLPYRHGLDFVTDITSAIASQAGEASSARRARHAPAPETGPIPAEAQNLPADSGVLSRLLTSPTAAVFILLTVLALVAARGALGTGHLAGGALLAAPSTAAQWWSLYLESWHEIGIGSAVATAPYVLPLAVAGSLLLGKAWLVVDIVFLLAVPLAAFGGFVFLRRLTGARLPSLWGAVTYALVPVLGGAVNQGRLGTVVAALVLPWAAHAALFLAPRFSADRRWRAAWRTGLWLALLSAFVPLAWPMAVALVVIALATGVVIDRSTWATIRMAGPLLAAVAVVPVLLLPWSLGVPGSPSGIPWLTEAGLEAGDLLASLGAWDIVLGRPAGTGAAPGWISAGIALAAVAALLRRDTRLRVVHAWVVLVVGLVTIGLVQPPVWLGFPFLLAQAAGICAAAQAATGISSVVSGSSFGWRQPVALLVTGAAVLSPLAGLVWWVATGINGPLDRVPVQQVPTYMASAAAADPEHGVLVVRGGRTPGFEYLVLRGDGLRLGDESVLLPAESQQLLTDLVADLATSPTPENVSDLSQYGVAFIYAPPPADTSLAGNLDSVSGLRSASAVRPGSRAWQLEEEPGDAALNQPPGSARPWLLVVQLVALAVVMVLAAPTRGARR